MYFRKVYQAYASSKVCEFIGVKYILNINCGICDEIMVYQNSYQMEGEEHDWEYHATVFVYITSSHAKHLEKNCHQYLSLYHSPVYNPENINC